MLYTGNPCGITLNIQCGMYISSMWSTFPIVQFKLVRDHRCTVLHFEVEPFIGVK